MQKPKNSRSGDTYKFHFFKKTLYLTHMVTNSSSYKSDSQQQRDHCFCVYGLTLPRAQKKTKQDGCASLARCVNESNKGQFK